MNAEGRNTAERLAIQAAQKDPARFAALYEDNFERVYAYVARRVGDRAEAEDITSDVFQQALANLSRFEWRGAPFAAWLFKIAANAIIDRAKRNNRQLELGANFDVPADLAFQEMDDEIEQRARVFKLVNQLPQDQRRVIEARFAEEKSIREIAGELGRSEGAIKQLQFRALEKLRAHLRDS